MDAAATPGVGEGPDVHTYRREVSPRLSVLVITSTQWPGDSYTTSVAPEQEHTRVASMSQSLPAVNSLASCFVCSAQRLCPVAPP